MIFNGSHLSVTPPPLRALPRVMLLCTFWVLEMIRSLNKKPKKREEKRKQGTRGRITKRCASNVPGRIPAKIRGLVCVWREIKRRRKPGHTPLMLVNT